ncbi:hypothetical protein [Paenarthrobacter nicotinovorans]
MPFYTSGIYIMPGRGKVWNVDLGRGGYAADIPAITAPRRFQ